MIGRIFLIHCQHHWHYKIIDRKIIYNNIGLLYKGGRLTESARLYITVLTNVYRGASNSTVFAEACLTACSIYWVAMYPGGALLL